MTEQNSHTVSTRTFVLVWIALVILTGVTIIAARLHVGAWSMLTNILIASTKAILVFWFFMHLKHEGRLFKWMIFIPIVTISVIIGLTFFDIWYR